MKIFREGIGAGAEKQYHLLSAHWNRDRLPDCYLYWNAFTRDRGRLEKARRRGVPIISRVGGWHFGESEETTAWVLKHSDAAIFVSEYTQQLARKRFDKLPEKQTVIINSVEAAEHKPLADPPYLLIRAGSFNLPIWQRHMLSRSLSIVAAWKVILHLRGMYPGLGIKVIGKTNRILNERYAGEAVEFLPYTDNEAKLHNLGSGAAALVHLIIGDYCPNTVCEIIGEGRPAIVLDRGGAKEAAGQAGIVVPTIRSECQFLGEWDVWWPLDRNTYGLDIVGFESAVRSALEYPSAWRKAARKRAEELRPKTVAGKYADFIRLCAK